jgi:hypothetical protein
MKFWRSTSGSDICKALVAVLLVLSIAATAQAENQTNGVVMDYQGKPGIWLSLETHESMLADLRQFPAYQQRVTLLESKLALETANMLDLRRSLDLAVESRGQAVEAVEEAVRGRREAEESRDAWHRSRVLWFAVGFVAALAVTYGAAKLLESAK